MKWCTNIDSFCLSIKTENKVTVLVQDIVRLYSPKSKNFHKSTPTVCSSKAREHALK